MSSEIRRKGGEKLLIILSSKGKHMSELDKRKLAKVIEVIIPMLIESNRAISSMSDRVRLESWLILR
jgi:hypothetical protein